MRRLLLSFQTAAHSFLKLLSIIGGICGCDDDDRDEQRAKLRSLDFGDNSVGKVLYL